MLAIPGKQCPPEQLNFICHPQSRFLYASWRHTSDTESVVIAVTASEFQENL